MASHDSPNASHDVVIVGGGLVGASLALALERQGLDVAMVEATPAARLPEVFDQRNLSLAEASVNALDALGVLPALRAPSGRIRRIHVSRAGVFGRVLLRAEDHGREAFGRVVVARDLGDALEARLRSLSNLARHRPARFLGLDEGDGEWRRIRVATGSGEQILATRLLVAADGSDSAVRAALDDAAFLARVQRAFGWRAGRFLEVGPRSAYPAQRIVADALHAPRAALVGNAAQSLHPVGAQGFNLGLRDALTLAEMLEAEGIAAVSADLLDRYAQRRREDRERTLAFSDGLARFTANEDLSALRALGWFAAGRSPSLQARLVGGAMGYRGDVPALCRGRA
jgi:2-octaprenyl-6-methoxyphenol hydroxylase